MMPREWDLHLVLGWQPPSWRHFVSVIGRNTSFPRALLPEGKGRAVLASPQAFVHEGGGWERRRPDDPI